MTIHACDGAPDYDGGEYIIARCLCGWENDGFPGLEEAIDDLMDHARREGHQEANGYECTRSHDD